MFDIVIIGGGHAGVEAAWIADQYKLNIAIVTLPGVGLASTPCNPAIGGVGKGQVVRELDALGGLMGRIADLSGIQYRTLNESKGFAVHSTRAQVDKLQYSKYATQIIEQETDIEIIRSKVVAVEKNKNFSIKLENGSKITARKLIVTAGTFLSGKTHIGDEIRSGGRYNLDNSPGAKTIFGNIKTNKKKFKTGTPPRLDKNTINYNEMEIQPSDPSTKNFHYLHDEYQRNLKQIDCYIVSTNEDTHNLIENSKECSPMFNGQIEAVGPRYCPSIEDKVFRYPDRKSHHLFIEKEGHELETVYPNGLSTSLPKDIQRKILKTIPSLENAEIINYGYAVEYDVIDTRALDTNLMYLDYEGLYFAGQVNGTSGYEEAAAQGFVAGLNASRSILNLEPIKFDRRNSYIGVLIEDLVTNYREEPYRLFTARSENRLYIREDNSFERMSSYREQFLLNNNLDRFYNKYKKIKNSIEKAINYENLKSSENKSLYNEFNIPESEKGYFLKEILKMGHVNPVSFLDKYFLNIGLQIPSFILSEVAISTKYEGYIARSDREYKKVGKLDNKSINWEKLEDSTNISNECRQLIKSIKPKTFSELKNINGIRPATLAFVACNL